MKAVLLGSGICFVLMFLGCDYSYQNERYSSSLRDISGISSNPSKEQNFSIYRDGETVFYRSCSNDSVIPDRTCFVESPVSYIDEMPYLHYQSIVERVIERKINDKLILLEDEEKIVTEEITAIEAIIRTLNFDIKKSEDALSVLQVEEKGIADDIDFYQELIDDIDYQISSGSLSEEDRKVLVNRCIAYKAKKRSLVLEQRDNLKSQQEISSGPIKDLGERLTNQKDKLPPLQEELIAIREDISTAREESQEKVQEVSRALESGERLILHQGQSLFKTILMPFHVHTWGESHQSGMVFGDLDLRVKIGSRGYSYLAVERSIYSGFTPRISNEDFSISIEIYKDRVYKTSVFSIKKVEGTPYSEVKVRIKADYSFQYYLID